MSPNNQHRTSVAPDIERAQKPPVGARLLSSLPRQLGAAALIALMALVSTATASHAWQCIISEQAIATALCEDGVCSEGFGIDYVVSVKHFCE